MKLTDPIPLPRPKDPMLVRWTLSFLAVDFAIIGLSAIGCILDPVMCGVAVGFFFAAAYAPILPLVAAFPADALAYETALLLVPVISMLLHAVCGIAAWRLTNRRCVRRRFTFGIGIGIVLLTTLIAFRFQDRAPKHSPSTAPIETHAQTASDGSGPVWYAYADPRWDLVIEFPSGLTIVPFGPDANPEGTSRPRPKELLPDGGVTFSHPPDGPGAISVAVFEDTPFMTPEEWVDARNAFGNGTVIESESEVHGYRALITHPASIMDDGTVFEEFPYEKRAVFIRGSDLFTVYVRFAEPPSDFARLLNSIRFPEPPGGPPWEPRP